MDMEMGEGPLKVKLLEKLLEKLQMLPDEGEEMPEGESSLESEDCEMCKLGECEEHKGESMPKVEKEKPEELE